MRKEIHYILLAHVLVVLFLVYQTFDLITLLYDDSFQDALLDTELNPVAGTDRPQLIPKIIHQTYKTADIPEVWKAGQQRCIELHPDYQYILWTDESSRDFIAQEYPWFLDTFDNYRYPIQRADAIRYFILNHFGGIYIDLDDGCARKMDPLLTVPAFVRKTIPTGISNDAMGSVPRHPFFAKAIDSLNKYNNNWLVPYITIMYSTGPLFLSVVWKQYKRWGVSDSDTVRILMPNDYKNGENPFFKISKGSSWHMDDAKFMFLMSKHIVWAVLGGFVVAGVFLYLEFLMYQFVISNSFKRFRKGVWNVVRFKSWSHGNNYIRLNSHKQAKYLKTRNRKDSNLPVAISIDVEKNVMEVEEEV